ncbi:MAG TPA: PAS domain S-box protein [Chitinophagaceae bacterium]|jgi:PAS domain S-box-containing protein|nr:PAS domain S-box protein [Chitinophagaceae bacterium]
MIAERVAPPIDLLLTLNAIPGNHVFLLTDAPTFTIIGATDSFLRTSYTSRERIIGKPLFEVFTDNTANNQPTGVSNLRASLNHVLDQKETHFMADQRYDIINPHTGSFEFKVWAASNAPVLNAEGVIQYIIHTTADITEKVRLQEESAAKEEKLQESENRFRRMVEQAPVAILLSRGEDVVIESINEPMLRFINKTSVEEVLGKKMLEVLPELEGQEALQIVKNVQNTGIPFNSDEQPVDLLIEGQLKRHFFNFSYTPIIEAGIVTGVLHVAIDITQQVEARKTTEESEVRFRSIADQSPMIVFMVEPDAEIRVSYFNKTWLQYTGQSFEEALGRAWDGIVHPGDVPGVFDIYIPAFQNREAYVLPALRLRRHDGEYRWHYFKGTPRFLPTGEFMGYIGVGIDIHEQKLASEAIKESEARSKAAIDIARLGSYEINVQEQTIIYTPRAAGILGLDPLKEWSYETFFNAVHPEDAEVRVKALEEAKRTGELFYEARIVRPEGSIRWVRLNGRFIHHDGQPMIIGTLMDITEERETAEVLEQKVEERTRELKQVNDQLRHFAYSASHDLQEPLRKITYFIDRLLQNLGSSVNEEDKKIAERIQHTTGRMRVLIDDLLSYSNTTLGIATTEEVNLTSLVKDVLDDMEATLIEQDAKIELQDLPLVKGDHRQLRQLMQNLISNAVKYRSKDKKPRVQISAQAIHGVDVKADIPPDIRTKSLSLITIKDNGIGFHPDDADRIFRLFLRLHGKSEYEGTGVGLAIVQKVVENHHGYIWAKGEPGEGATFYILLPAG